MSSVKYVTWAEKNGFMPDYNKPLNQPKYFRVQNLPAAFCIECKQSFETRQSNGKKNKINKLKTIYLPGGFPTLSLDKTVCGKCLSKGE